MDKQNQIISKIESFKPDNGNWLELDNLISELWNNGNPESCKNVLFRVFERFPMEDGAGVFWTLLHGLETLDYEQELYESLNRRPALMTITMLNRIENSDMQTIAGISISELKEMIIKNPKTENELLNSLS